MLNFLAVSQAVVNRHWYVIQTLPQIISIASFPIKHSQPANMALLYKSQNNPTAKYVNST